ncbi:MAG: hypothetical protein MUC83_16835 [Pirellula sp.]|nr:hypothetical protein [Pirellula sp.]
MMKLVQAWISPVSFMPRSSVFHFTKLFMERVPRSFHHRSELNQDSGLFNVESMAPLIGVKQRVTKVPIHNPIPGKDITNIFW